MLGNGVPTLGNGEPILGNVIPMLGLLIPILGYDKPTLGNAKQYNFVYFNDKERVCTILCITTFPTTVSLYGKLFSKICSDNFHYYTKVWEIFHSPLERGVTHSYKYVSL